MSDANPRRRSSLTSVSIVAFSLTLLGAGVAMLAGAVPLRHITATQITDAGTLVVVAAILALVLALCVEVARIAVAARPLPQPRLVRIVQWTPGEREG